jgi:hypothetical protein
MRWIIPLSSLAVGVCVGLGVGAGVAPTRVVVRDSVPSAVAPSMNEARFLACSEAQVVEFSEAEWAALWVGWRLRHSWPEWGTP